MWMWYHNNGHYPHPRRTVWLFRAGLAFQLMLHLLGMSAAMAETKMSFAVPAAGFHPQLGEHEWQPAAGSLQHGLEKGKRDFRKSVMGPLAMRRKG